MTQPASGTVSFLFTDIEGSTHLWDSVPEAMGPALERHDEIFRDSIAACDGYVFSIGGDGFGAAFARAADALSVAVAMQEALAAEPWPKGAVVRVRMGVHTGEASERDGNYFGTAVNRAARLMAVAHGGQVVCSQASAALAGDAVSLKSLGEHRLRDLAAAEQIFQVGDGAFPPLRSVDAVPTNLPTVRTELIGRTDDVTELMELVERERLVTLTGVGGVGKTRLALGVAASIAAGFPDGCWLVELSPVADGDEVVKAVAAAMRAPTTTADALVDYLADRRVLIVLDNCEHVLDAAADLVDAIAAAAADVHFLVTSREPLGLDGEQVRRVHSLALPAAEAGPQEAEATAAVRLFAERAAAASARFTIDAGNVGAVVEICRHLDGIPLAIELAAARVRAMAPAEIARRLDERFRLLAGGSRRSQERHRTLLATVAWSHDLLTDDEKITFRRLAVFPASFDLEAAETVAGNGTIDVVDCVLRLVDRSLVMFEPEEDRYRLLETLRQYGADRLAEAGETEEVRARHARYFLALGERVAPELTDARFFAARAVLTPELDNLRATADWCVESDQWTELGSIALGLWYFLSESAPVDGAAWIRHVLTHEAALDDQMVVDCLGELAYCEAAGFGNYAEAFGLSELSHARAHAAGAQASPAAWLAQSIGAAFTREPAQALGFGDQALAAADQRGDVRNAVLSLCIQTGVLPLAGDPARSTESAAETLRRAEEAGHPILISAAINSAAGALMQGSPTPDFPAGFEILSRHDIVDVGDGLGGLWLEIEWGAAFLGLDRSEAVVHAVRAARLGDRLSASHLFDFALRQLALVAFRAGRYEQGSALIDFTEATLRQYRLEDPGQDWLQAELDRALADAPAQPHGPALHRGEVMAIVSEIETELGSALSAEVRTQ